MISVNKLKTNITSPLLGHMIIHFKVEKYYHFTSSGSSTIYSKQGRDVTLSSRKLAIARKIWIYHVQELEKLFTAKLLNFRERFFLLLNLAFSKKSRKGSRFWVFRYDHGHSKIVQENCVGGAVGSEYDLESLGEGSNPTDSLFFYRNHPSS